MSDLTLDKDGSMWLGDSGQLPMLSGLHEVIECPHCAAKFLVRIRTQARVMAVPATEPGPDLLEE